MYENIPHTPSKVGVLQRIIFSHTPDEAMSVGLAKACVPGENCSVPEKTEFLIIFNVCLLSFVKLDVNLNGPTKVSKSLFGISLSMFS